MGSGVEPHWRVWTAEIIRKKNYWGSRNTLLIGSRLTWGCSTVLRCAGMLASSTAKDAVLTKMAAHAVLIVGQRSRWQQRRGGAIATPSEKRENKIKENFERK